MNTINYKLISKDSVVDKQLRLKVLHLHNKGSSTEATKYTHIRRVSLKILYYLNLKKVTSSKFSNRIIRNYFKHFFSLLGKEHFKYISRNKANFDVNYNSTIAITSLYDLESG